MWILLAATPAFADGGPHTQDINNGTQGLAGDCAACHRAHQAEATDLLKTEQPALCLSCHNGTGATADVVDGVQFVPSSWTGNPNTSPVLGALRGGGFSYALLNTSAPDRLSYNSRGGTLVSFDAAVVSGSVTLHWTAFGAFGGGDLTFNPADAAGTVQTAVNSLFGTSTTYTGSTALQYMSGLPAGGANMTVSKSTDGKTFTFATQNALRLFPVPLPSVTADTTGQNAKVADGISIGQASHVGVLNAGAAVTSTHLGAGTVWGNGPQGQGNAGATGVTLECTNCHNPHGNGQYRILNTLPGEDWTNGTGGVASWTDPTNDVEVIDGPALGAGEVHNYTVQPGYLATDVTGTHTDGDYFRYKWDPTGATNFTNFYLLKDPMNSGWNGQTPTNEAAIASIPNTTLTASLTISGTTATVASTAGMPTHTPTTEPQPLFLVKIGSEILTANVASATTLKVSRAQYGTAAAAYSSGATVTIIRSDSTDPSAYLYNNTGRMTAWCIACHTRYNGWAQNGTSSLNAQTPSDAIFGFKHGTTSTGCEQCHVNHGTNAVMSGITLGVTFPGGAVPEDSALLKVNNRGTCQLCHDPTGTVPAGNTEGVVPGSIAN